MNAMWFPNDLLPQLLRDMNDYTLDRTFLQLQLQLLVLEYACSIEYGYGYYSVILITVLGTGSGVATEYIYRGAGVCRVGHVCGALRVPAMGHMGVCTCAPRAGWGMVYLPCAYTGKWVCV